MGKIRNIIFDLGNVLLGYRWRQMLMDYGLTETEADRVGTEMFDDPRKLWHAFDLGIYTEDEMCAEFAKEWPQDAEVIAYFIHHGEYMPVPRPKVWKRVHALKEKGFRVYLLSNYPEVLFHKHTQYCDFMKDLDGMVISYQHHEGKPDRAIYDRLCRTYDLKLSESLFFDDREDNIQGALAYGLPARIVRSQESLLEDLDAILRGDYVNTDDIADQTGETGSGSDPAVTTGFRNVNKISDSRDSGSRRRLKIAVYCGANAGDRPEYMEAAEKLGTWIGSHGHTLVYGAGALGMMGKVADNVRESGGRIIGVIPRFMVENGWQKDGLDEMIVTGSMSERKMKMLELADICVALPGGPGTVDEIAEAISLSALHLHDKECILCSAKGYYEPLRQMYERMVLASFAPEEKLEHTHFAAGTEEMLDMLENISRKA